MKIPFFDTKNIVKNYYPNALNISQVYSSGLTIRGPFQKKFADKIQTFLQLNSIYVNFFNSGGACIFSAIRSLNLPSGSEVILPMYCHQSDISAITFNNLTPQFIDVQDDGFIDLENLEKKINNNTKAILMVYMHGKIVDAKKLNILAKKYKLKIIHDCSQIFGNTNVFYNKKQIYCFSTHLMKNLTCLSDSAFSITGSKLSFSKLNNILDYGGDNSIPKINQIGLNMRLNEMQVFCGIESLKTLKNRMNKKNNLKKAYLNTLLNISSKNEQFYQNASPYSPNMPILFETKIQRDYIYSHLSKLNIHVQKSIPPFKINLKDYPNSRTLFNNGLYLPFYETMSLKEVNHISKSILLGIKKRNKGIKNE